MRRGFTLATAPIAAAGCLWFLALLIIGDNAPAEARPASGPGADASTPKEALTVERIFADPPLAGTRPSNLRWLPNSEGISYLIEEGAEDAQQTKLVVTEVPSGKQTIICIADTIRIPEDLEKDEDAVFSIGSYEWIGAGKMIVFGYGGDVFTLNVKSGEVVRRTKTDEDEENLTVAPDGKSLAFTREHDIYVLDLEDNAVTRLTNDGSDTMYNGVLDWIYMEELFTRGDVQGYWWSPDSRAIAFLQIDETPVPEFSIVDFLPTHNTAELQRYPKAGDPNPIVRVGVCDLERREVTWMDVDTGDDSYIARVYWLGDGRRLAIEKLNRAQNDLRLLFADAQTGAVTEVLAEESPAWINVSYMKHYYENKPQFIWSSERDGYNHLYLYNIEGTLIRRLTNGSWGVSDLYGADELRGGIYFAALQKSILERHLYRVSEKGGGIERISRRAGTHSVTFSPDYRYYIDRFSNVTMPTIISVRHANGDEVIKVGDQGSPLGEYELPETEFLTITSAEGLEFQCSMIKPLDFDPSREYPVLVYVYGGPGSQVVRNRWGGSSQLWHLFMASRGYIVFSLDNRGSYGKGRAWEDVVLKQLGYYELEDQLAGVEYLKTLPYVNPKRIGIWGWSYGGYMTALAMFKAPDVFKAGAAVAPATDWHLYDSIYTERYMKRPEDNPVGYAEASPLNHVDGLKGSFLLMHGTDDDNVHMQNSIKLTKAFIESGKDFDLMLYPGKDHSIRGEKSRTHLFSKLTRFFDENL
jgi:dipeptidyl-peptidase-4